MTSSPAAPPPPPSVTCVLCGSARASIAQRCRVCGMHPGLGRTEIDPFDVKARWLIGGVFVAIYIVVLVGVVLAN